MSVSQIASRTVNLTNDLLGFNQGLQKALQTAGAAQWFQPTGWDGNVHNIANLGAGMDREELYTMFRAAMNPGNTGTAGDLGAILVQGDNLAAAERAFRQRHAGSIRTKMHAAARHRGHAADAGVPNNGQANYLKQLVRLASG